MIIKKKKNEEESEKSALNHKFFVIFSFYQKIRSNLKKKIVSVFSIFQNKNFNQISLF